MSFLTVFISAYQSFAADLPDRASISATTSPNAPSAPSSQSQPDAAASSRRPCLPAPRAQTPSPAIADYGRGVSAAAVVELRMMAQAGDDGDSAAESLDQVADRGAPLATAGLFCVYSVVFL